MITVGFSLTSYSSITDFMYSGFFKKIYILNLSEDLMFCRNVVMNETHEAQLQQRSMKEGYPLFFVILFYPIILSVWFSIETCISKSFCNMIKKYDTAVAVVSSSFVLYHAMLFTTKNKA